uniref:Uncharacterized protein n=1 Tax=Rhizophora mucronata TaxID=61149 RepID=A0A2P2NPL3_RHIMU
MLTVLLNNFFKQCNASIVSPLIISSVGDKGTQFLFGLYFEHRLLTC